MNTLRDLLYRHGWDTRCRNLCPARMLRQRLPAEALRECPAILDVGSGTLGLAAFLRGISVVGSDVEPVQGVTATRAFIRSTVTALPFKDRAFPAVTCIDVLEHLGGPQRLEAIRECVRVADRLALFAFPDGAQARRHDERFRAACEAHARPLPAWVSEHLQHEYPEAAHIAEHVRRIADALGRRVSLTSASCEPLAIGRIVRAAASRSSILYLLCNFWFGLWAPLLRASGRQGSYRAILVAELSPA